MGESKQFIGKIIGRGPQGGGERANL